MPLYPGIPYGNAPVWSFPLFEFSMYILFFICLFYAIKKGKRDVMYLLGGLSFGLILEYIEVISKMGYTYGHFIVMFGKAPLDIPLCIGVGWGIIMYSARLFTDKLGLPLLACAALDTLLALNIDLSMDTVAYRMHMWHWDWSDTNLNPLTADWFGIPYGNFFGWQTVIFCYSFFSRTFEKIFTRKKEGTLITFILVAFLALLCSQIVLYVMEVYIESFLYNKFGITSLYRFLIFLFVLLGLAAFGWRKKKAITNKIPMITWWVPGWFHLFFFSCLFICGFYTENKWMNIAACINILIGIAVHILPVNINKEKIK